MSIAVRECVDVEQGVAWLRSHDFDSLLERILATDKKLASEIEAGRLPSSVIAGNYHPLVYAHVAWCVQRFDLGKSFVAFAERKDVGELGTPFWREYARGMGSLVKGESYHPVQLRLKGQEKYWVTYLYLIEAASNGQSVEDVVADLDKEFVARNNDKNIKDDAYQIEGSGNQPVKWDFRRHGLLNYLTHKQSR